MQKSEDQGREANTKFDDRRLSMSHNMIKDLSTKAEGTFSDN